MIKQKSKFRGIFKGAAIGFAFVMCAAFFPAKAVADVYADWKYSKDSKISASAISVAGSESLTVKKGDTVNIPVGTYEYKKADGSKETHQIGSVTGTDDITESSVEVFYKSTNDVIKDKATSADTFVADRVGRYTITYTVVQKGMVYTYDLIVNSQVSEATFEFSSNNKNIIPSVYDADYIEKNKNLVNGDIILPLPVVKNGDEVIFDGKDINNYTLADSADGDSFVKISLNNKSIQIKEHKQEDATTDFYLAKEDLINSQINGQSITVIYSYYQKKGETPIFVASTSKTFKIEKGYYHKNSNTDAETGYDLVTNWSSSVSDLTGVVGVEKELPKITATTSSTNDPANEAVEVWYKIEVKKKLSNGYSEDMSETLIKDGKFTAQEEGSYNFTYYVTDFYGNTVETTKTSFDISNIKDSLSANVYVYDGGEKEAAYDEDKNEYHSALNMLKNQTDKRNIIMYAVGGTDNMRSNNSSLTLRRTILDNNGVTMFNVDNSKYHKYNLIFAPGLASGEEEDIYERIYSDNYHIRKQMLLATTPEGGAKYTRFDSEEILSFLKENNYLLVTTELNKTFDGKDIVDGASFTEATDEAIEKMMLLEDPTKLGYAYVPAQNNKEEFTDGTYTFVYGAKDKDNPEATQRYSFIVSKDYTDSAIPTLSFNSDLQVTYLATDKIEFNVATATDATSEDSRLETVTAYRFLKDRGDASKAEGSLVPETNNEAYSSLRYYITNAKSELSNESTGVWYAKTGKVIESKGWIYDKTKSSYSIDLKNAPTGAKYIQILAYAIDDYGNAGFFNKIIKIADSTDSKAPEIYQIAGFEENQEGKYKAPMEIDLPTLYFTDDNVDYMSAEVNVYKLIYGTSEEDREKIVDKVIMQSSDMSTSFDSMRGVFTLKGGSFRASTSGKYQVAMTVTDAGNHSVTTYFNYEVGGGVVVEAPEINNITSQTIDLEAGQSYYLAPPTLSITENNDFGYIGIEEGDDLNTATYYAPTIISATDEYKLDKYYFRGNKKGTFKLQYKVFLMQYDKKALAEDNASPEEGKLFFKKSNVDKTQEKLAYKDSSGEYFLYIEESVDEDTKEVSYVLKANDDIRGIGKNLDNLTEVSKLVEVYTCLSKIQTINVGGVQINVTLDKDVYAEVHEKTGDFIEIVKPNNIEFNGAGYETNAKDSTVTITRTSGNTTTTIGTFNFEDWSKDVPKNSESLFQTKDGKTPVQAEETGDRILLKLKDNGKYVIRYSIQAMDKSKTNVGDAKTLEFTISNGDIVEPTLKLEKNLVSAKYKLGDTMTLNIGAITVEDNNTTDNTRESLLKSMKVRIKNNDLDSNYTTLENQSKEGFVYTHKLETAGSYTLSITVSDDAGNERTKTFSFDVTADEKKAVDVKEVMGGVLIGLSVAILAGVVIYFVVSKIKLDKKEKQYKDK